jgi:hypothetical protein
VKKAKKLRLFLAYHVRDKKKGPSYVIAAYKHKQAANYLLQSRVATGQKVTTSDRVYVDEFVWDDQPGLKLATDTNGDRRYDVEYRGGDGTYKAVYSCKSYA